jgi:cytochrome c-type biogenesis protein
MPILRRSDVAVLEIRVQETSLLIGALIAFAGGLLSFVSPCVLPLVPGYLGYLAGTTVDAGTWRARRTVFWHGVSFVLGFSAVFTAAGIAVGQFLTNVQAAQGYVRWIGGCVIIVLGVHMTGLIRLPFLDRTLRVQPHAVLRPRRDPRHLGIIANPGPMRADDTGATGARDAGSATALAFGRSFLVGIVFAAGWSPCIGPILAGIYGVVGAQPAHGGVLLAVYSLGLGVPFLLVALLLGRASAILRRMNRYYGIISVVSGLLLILIGVLLLTNALARLAIYAPALNLPGVS